MPTGRNLTFQPLRGVQANLTTAMPLSLGEMYFCTDTSLLIFGTPGVGVGYITLGDVTQVNERLDRLTVIMEGVRRALVATALNDKVGCETDFDPETISKELGVMSPTGV